MRRPAAWLAVGLVAATAGLSPGQAPAPADDPLVEFHFEEVDIRLLTRQVGGLLDRRFILGPEVEGTVTVITPGRIRTSQVYPLFLRVLDSSGFTVVEEEGAYRVVRVPRGLDRTGPILAPDDPGPGEGLITRILPVRHVSVLEVKRVLDDLAGEGGMRGVTPFPATNQLVVTDTAARIARLEQILAQLDQPGASRTMEVVRLSHVPAEEMARSLTAAVQGLDSLGRGLARHMREVAGGAGAVAPTVVVVPMAQTNTLLLSGSPLEVGQVRDLIARLDIEPPADRGRLNAIFLKYLGAKSAAESLNALLAKAAGADQRPAIAIEPDLANNALLVESSPSEFEVVRALVERLDQVPQQVLVEVMIVEVALGTQMDLGVEWFVTDGFEEGSTRFFGRSRPGDTDVLGSIAEGVFPQGMTFGVVRGTETLPNGTVIPSVPVMLRALAQERDVKILSNIPLWAQNNKPASVSVVENIPVLKSTIEAGAGTARDVIQNIERLDVGIKLSVTPQVNQDSDIALELNPSIEAIIDDGPPGQFTPTLARREVSTTVTLPDRATVVISGLIREDRVQVVNRVPLLGRIPLLGALFRSTADRTQRTNVLIFVTPTIVNDAASFARARARWEALTGLEGPPPPDAPEEEATSEPPIGP